MTEICERENMNRSNALPATNYVTCPCQHCSGKIEFHASQLDPAETRTVPCPHCGSQTSISVPEQTAVLLPIVSEADLTPRVETRNTVENRDAISSLTHKEEAGFRFEVTEGEEYTLDNGSAAFIFFITITNLEPKARLIDLSLATYVTGDGEQLEQDDWLKGYFINHGRIKGNAHRKCGLIFYKSHLRGLSSEDTLFIEVAVPDKLKKLSIRFQQAPAKGMPWSNCAIDTEGFDVKPTPRVASKALTKGIERLEVFEERLGIVLDKLSVNVSDDYGSVTVVGEIHLKDGMSLAKDTSVVAVAYDSEGHIIKTGTTFLFAHTFSGFDVLDITLFATDIGSLATRIRVFPKAA